MQITQNCTGCMACYSKCPVDAIEIIQNKNGFYVPQINQEKCIQCKQCVMICPQNNNNNFNNKEQKTCYAVQASKELGQKSSSAGVFTLLAEEILNNGGYVCGAVFSNNFRKVEHVIIDNKHDLAKMRSSKYLQSYIGNVLKDVKTLLDNNKIVLFSGTGCQIAGLKSYLQKDYQNLYTVDILCHGAPSPKVWEKYLNEVSQNKTVADVNFRDKTIDWNTTLNINFTNNDSIREGAANNIYLQAFLTNIILNEACFYCKYTNITRLGDISLGDFWGIQTCDYEFSNPYPGVSLVIVNNEKGEDILNKIKTKLIKIKTHDISDAIKGNSVLETTIEKHCNIDKFFENIDKLPILENLQTCLEKKYDGIIANFWWTPNNYGAVLSAYAIQKFFYDEGYNYPLLNFVPGNKLSSFSKNFVQKYLKLTHKIYNEKELYDLNNCTDTFIVGTDQVFRYLYIQNKFPAYLLNYTDFNKKRIAFSASFGKDKFDEANFIQKFFFKKYLKRFNAISLREKSGVKLCKKEFNIKAENILDPVFLIDKNIWDKIADSVNTECDNKIIAYILDETIDTEQISKFLETKYNRKIKNLCNSECSPEEFLSYIKNSEYFITDSFHGICFALIFNKKAICLINKKRGNSRFENLVYKFNIPQIFYENYEQIKNSKALFQEIDRNNFDKVIENERQFAKKWLNNAMQIENKASIFTEINENFLRKSLAIMNANILDEIKQKCAIIVDEINFIFSIHKLRKQKIVFWGASLFLKNIIQKYHINNKNIIGIIDKDPSKTGLKYGSYDIYTPDKLSTLNPDTIIFAVRNKHEQIYPIIQEILEKNNPNIKLFPDIFLN